VPRGDKSSYTDKQKRKAEHIEEGYEKRGVSKKEAESRAWATVNKESGGGNKSGSGRGKTGQPCLIAQGRLVRKPLGSGSLGGREKRLGDAAEEGERLDRRRERPDCGATASREQSFASSERLQRW
jgi:plasmid stabilization system protein ParE